jgi:hypothetical protein
MRPVLLPVASASSKDTQHRPIGGCHGCRVRILEHILPLRHPTSPVPMQDHELRTIGVLGSSTSRHSRPWFAFEGSDPFETSQARTGTVGLPGVASGNCTPCGIRSIGSPDAASILPVQLNNEMSAVAS